MQTTGARAREPDNTMYRINRRRFRVTARRRRGTCKGHDDERFVNMLQYAHIVYKFPWPPHAGRNNNILLRTYMLYPNVHTVL